MDPVAVVGVSCRIPGAAGIDALWRLLAEGRSAIREVPADRWDAAELYDPVIGTPGKMNTRWGAFLDDIDRFDAKFFGISTREANDVDPQQRLLLEVAWEALERGGIPAAALAGTRTGVFIGIGGVDYSQVGLLLPNRLERISPYTGTGNAHSIAANRLSYFFDLRGPSLALDTACSSSLVAIHFACNSLTSGESDTAIAGGVNLVLSPEVSIAFSHAHMLASDGRCKTFDASADGYVRGEGCGLVVLKRLADALRDGNHIFGVIRGTAVNQDGRSNGLTAPNGVAQQAVLRTALAEAGIRPAQVSYVEAHGTGTPLGDPIEVRALTAVLAEGRPADDRCAIGSIKTNIGHLETASGIAGLLKAMLALDREEIPPHLHLETLNQHIELPETFLIPRERIPWPRGERPRYCGVSSYGFGGTNAHVILQEPPEIAQPPARRRSAELFTLSARSPQALRNLAGEYATWLRERPGLELTDVCLTAATGRTHFAAHRIAITAHSIDELRNRLQTFVGEERGATNGSAAPGSRRIAFLFSGQGVQYSGMGRELYDEVPAFRDTLDDCARIAEPYLDVPLTAVLFDQAFASKLDQTQYTQPALFALEYALAKTWQSLGITPHAVIGHSLGELTAAAAAGAMSLTDALLLVCERARLMQALPAGGTMLAVAAAEEVVTAALERHPELSIASINGANNVVVSGEREAVTRFAQQLEEQGIASTPLNVSHAFHSKRVEPMLEPFAQAAANVRFAPPAIPLVSNVTGTLSATPSAAYYARHIRSAVRFRDGIDALVAAGCDLFVEIGPGSTLTDIGKRSGAAPREAFVASMRPGRSALDSLLDCAGTLYTRGALPDWRALFGGQTRVPVPLPTYAFDREVHWMEERRARVTSAPRSSPHPLLGRRLPSAIATFESHVRIRDFPYFGDHRVGGAAVFPAAAYIEIALAAARELNGDERPVALGDLEFIRPLVLDGERATSLQTTITHDALGEATVSIYSRADGNAWTRHAVAHIAAAGARAEDDPAIAERCRNEVPASELYENLAAAGLEYGPAFQGVRSVAVGVGEAVGVIAPPEAIAGSSARYLMHPALLDSAFHVIAAAIAASSDRRGTYIPVGVKHVRFDHRAPEGELHASVRVGGRTDDALHVEGDVTLFGRDGTAVVTVRGLAAERVDLGGAAPKLEEHVFDLSWEAVEPPDESGPSEMAANRAWLVLSDRGEVAERFMRWAALSGVPVVRVFAGIQFDDVAERTFVIDPSKLDHYRHLFGMLLESDLPPIHAVANFWALDARPSGPDLDEAIALGPMSLFHLVHAVAEIQWQDYPRLWVVTAGAVAVDDGEDAAVAQSPILGMTRTLRREHPEFAPALVDLSASPTDEELASLFALFSRGGDTAQVALRGRSTRVALLRRRERSAKVEESAAPVLSVPAGSYRLHAARPGVFDSLMLQPAPRRTPAAGEVEIAVRAVGLNFRDVMKALGIYPIAPGDMIWYGDECAAEVVATGDGVTHVRPGDRVVAMAPGAFAEYVTTPAAFVEKIPDTLSFEEAATLLVAFTTARYGLLHLARLRRGERVLIHAGAGGVGMAAIQVARAAGAEVFATAGTDARREILLSLGVTHTFDSRSLSFAEEILAVTNGRGVDVVLNSLAGEALLKSFAILAPYGRFIEIGKKDIYQNHKLDLQPFMRNLSFFALDMDRLFRERGDDAAALMTEVLDAVRSGTYRPLPFTTFPITDVRAAFRTMAQAQHTGKVVVQIPQHTAEANRASRFRTDATYWITGGCGALGLQVARSMVDQGARHVVLSGRSAAESDAVAALRRSGADVRVEKVDVGDTGAMGDLLARIHATMPPLRGIIHAAGVLDDALLLNLTEARVHDVLRPKVAGAWNLHVLTLGRELDFFITFSSVASIFGSPGQSNYAAGNAFLDALERHRHFHGLPALNVNWGPWAESGMGATMRNRAALKSVRMIDPAEGVELLWQLLDARSGPAIVFDADWRRFFQLYPALRRTALFEPLAAGDLSTGVESRVADLLGDATGTRRIEILESLIQARLAKILGTSEDSLVTTEPLPTFGVDSLIAVELQSSLEREFEIVIPRVFLMQSPSIGGVAREIASLLDAKAFAVSPSQESVVLT